MAYPLPRIATQPTYPRAGDLVDAFDHRQGHWKERRFDELDPGTEVVFDNAFFRINPDGSLDWRSEIAVEKLLDADEIEIAPDEIRRPSEGWDVVRVTSATESYHAIIDNLPSGQKFFFQGIQYETTIRPDGVRTVVPTGMGLSRIVDKFERTVDTLIELTIEHADGKRDTIRATPEHPFYIPAKKIYIIAEDIPEGDELLTMTGERATLIAQKRLTGEFKVYNLEVSPTHNYFVSGSPDAPAVLVHNACGRKLGRALVVAGVPRPPNHAAHHIVAHTAERARPAQRTLERLGIGLDDAANGVFLPRNAAGQAASPRAAYHPSLHSYKYYDAVNNALDGVQTKEQAMGILDGIASQLRAGTFPH
ncbi:MAG: hypothetical protein HC927_06435 [Deltaproteobacteria bacterium]|nr:hypothetical protein [Deltaproteobacteria bacterium]